MWVRPLGRAKCRRMSQWNCRRWIDRHARGGRGGGAPAGGAPGAEPSARAGLWKRGSSLRGADDQPRFTGSSVGTSSLICQRTRASGRLRTRLPCGAGGGVKRLTTASSPTSHTPHPTASRRSRASSALIGGKAARRRRQPGRSEWSRRGRGSRIARGTSFTGFGGFHLTLPYRVIANLRTNFLGSICPPNHTKEINLT